MLAILHPGFIVIEIARLAIVSEDVVRRSCMLPDHVFAQQIVSMDVDVYIVTLKLEMIERIKIIAYARMKRCDMITSYCTAGH